MAEITDDDMRAMLTQTKAYTVVLLRPNIAGASGGPSGPRQSGEHGDEAIRWEHARRNFALRADGVLAIVCPVTDGSNLSGVGIFDADVDETRRIMDDDPGVRAGLFTYDVHAVRSFPGDCLPS